MQLRNCAEVFRSCRRRSHDDGWGESLCLCCSRDSLEALWNAPQSEMRRGDRQRIPRNESPKTRLFARGTGGFESISLQAASRLLSVTPPRFAFAKTETPFRDRGPMVRILLPPGAGLQTLGPSRNRPLGTRSRPALLYRTNIPTRPLESPDATGNRGRGTP